MAYLFLRADRSAGIGVMRADGTDRREIRGEIADSLDWGYAPRR
jgi:hypothetical protein